MIIAQLLVIFGVGAALYHIGVWRGRVTAMAAVRACGTRLTELERDVDHLSHFVGRQLAEVVGEG